MLQEDYAKKTYQQYWYYGVVPIRRYYQQQGIGMYTSESINDCVAWFRERYKQSNVYPEKFKAVRKIAAIMERIAAGEPYQWQSLTPWYIVNPSPAYHSLLEDYAEQKRKNGCKETIVRGTKPIIKHFLMYAVFFRYESVRNITLTDVISYIPKLAESYQHIGDALSILRGRLWNLSL